MKVVIAGGSGHVGSSLIRHLVTMGHSIVVISRTKSTLPNSKVVNWDGKSLGDWTEVLNGSDVIINLAGRSVNCRYTSKNLAEMMDSRINSTKIIGKAISQSKNPPKVWLQASTATIYCHRVDAANDEISGIIGGNEPKAPFKWNASVEIAKAWELALEEASTPDTRKVALRSALTLSPDKGSVFDVFAHLARLGIGGKLGSGKQFVSWIHEDDFANALMFNVDNAQISGAVNICSPNPLPESKFMSILGKSVRAKFAFNFPSWMVEIGTRAIGTESELILKSRRAVPTRLLESGFQFKFPNWVDASNDLASKLI